MNIGDVVKTLISCMEHLSNEDKVWFASHILNGIDRPNWRIFIKELSIQHEEMLAKCISTFGINGTHH